MRRSCQHETRFWWRCLTTGDGTQMGASAATAAWQAAPERRGRRAKSLSGGWNRGAESETMSRPDRPGLAGSVAVAGQKGRRTPEARRAYLRLVAQCRVQSGRGWTNARTARLGRGPGKTFWLSVGEKRRSEAPAYLLSKLRLRPR